MQMPEWWRHSKWRVIGALGALVVALGGTWLIWSANTPSQPDEGLELLQDDVAQGAELAAPLAAVASPAPELTPTPAPIVVYITGAVLRPDVYTLPSNARVKDAVLAAGGLHPDAASEQINLAASIRDAEHIHIPRVGEAPAALPAGTAEPGAAQPASNGQININTANATELEDLPGIGQTLAERIVTYREANGPFATPDDLRKVPGIGAKLFEEISPLITVGI